MLVSTEIVLHSHMLSCWLNSVEYFILNQNLKLWYTVWITKEHVFTFFSNIFLSTKKLTAYVILFQVFFLISSHVRYILEFWYKSHITGYGAKKVFTQKVETFAILQAWQCLFTRFHSNTFYSVCELASTTTSQFLVQIHKHLHSCFSANMCEGNYGYELASTTTSHVLVQICFIEVHKRIFEHFDTWLS